MQNEDIVVSVIVLTYNHEKYIAQALDSILMQEVDFRYEILVGDDASSDRTPDIVREYAEKFPHIFRLSLRPSNVGASRNAYELLMAAKGKFLATCEGDDYWTDTQKLRIQISYLESRPDVSGCVHPCLVVDEQGQARRMQSLSWVRPKPVFTLQDFHGIYLPGQYATFVRRNIFLNPKYDYSVIYHGHSMVADRTALMLYLLDGDIHYIDRRMSCYRKVFKKTDKNLTTVCFAQNRNRIQEEYRLLQTLEAFLSDVLGQPTRFERRRRELFTEACYSHLLRKGNQSLTLASELWRNGVDRWAYLAMCPVVIAKKIYEKIIQVLFRD